MPRKAKEKEIEKENVEEVVVSPKKSKSTGSSKKKTVSTKKDSKTEKVKKITTEKKTTAVAKSTEKSDKPKVSRTRTKKDSDSSNTDIVKATTTKTRKTKSDKIVDDAVVTPTSKKVTKSKKKSNTDSNIDNTLLSSKKKATRSKKDEPLDNFEDSDNSNKKGTKRRMKKDSTVSANKLQKAKPTEASGTKSTKSSKSTTPSRTKAKTSKVKSDSPAVSKTKKTKSATSAKSKKSKTNSAEIEILEYYDLPYKYGNTLVKLLAQTPKTLFVYWEISDLDIANYKEKYGDNFFFITKPILIVHNLTLDETYEVEINDFANCWYLNIENADCKYDIELARKFIQSPITKAAKKNKYLFISKSNDLTAPNDHILLEKLVNFVTFRDVSTGEHIKKNIKSFKFLNDLYEFYKNMYKDEILNNPSSNFSI